MGDLYPTPTRRQLLTDVDNGTITRVVAPDSEAYAQDGGMRRVTARIAELEQAGWVELDPDSVEQSDGWTFQEYRLTDVGSEVLGDG